MSQQRVSLKTTQPYLNLNLTLWPIWTHPTVMICVSPGARLVAHVREWLRQQTANITNDSMPNWRQTYIQGPIASMFLFISWRRVAFWWIWLSTSSATVIRTHGLGTLGISVVAPSGRLEGLLILWRSVISKVSSTLMPHTYAQRHAEREREREWKWEVGSGGR